jgi:hypothetical protein
MGALFIKVELTVGALIEFLDLGAIGLPDIQRPFVWKTAKVRDLFDSMYQGFPVGSLLFWKNEVAAGSRQIGFNNKQKVPDLLIVDGQQRLTSLYAVIKNREVLSKDYTQKKITIAFRPMDNKFAVTDAPISRDPEFIHDISQLWAGEIAIFAFITQFIQRLREHRENKGEILMKGEEDKISGAINDLYNLKNYSFTALQLSPSVDEEQVSQIFVRINSMGTPLNQADFILTLMSVFWDEGRTQLENFCRACRQPSVGGAAPFNHFIQPAPEQMLRIMVALGFRRARLEFVYSLLRGKDLETGEFSEEQRIKQFSMLENAQKFGLNLLNWNEFFKALLMAGYKADWMITSKIGLLYAYSMFLIGKNDFGLDFPTLRDAIARWFFMTALTARYSSSPESTMEQDLGRLRGIRDSQGFLENLDQLVDNTLTEDFWNISLPNSLATSAASSPSLNAYYAALNLLDARVLFSRTKVVDLMDPALKPPKAALERHHLFPRDYLKNRLGITEIRDQNQIANLALVEWFDNLDISNSPPLEYFPDFIEKAKNKRWLSEVDLQNMYYWHALPEGWTSMPYEEFLVARRQAMAKVIRAGFETLRGKTG